MLEGLNNKYYTGIGSSDTPPYVENLFVKLGRAFARSNYTLRSGHADESDSYFEHGCDIENGRKEIYIPWKGFNGSDSKLFHITTEMYEIAEYFHPNFSNLKSTVKKIHARNCSQILGLDLKTPSNLVVCYTKDGKMIGGTSQALRIAEYYKIPIFNLGSYSSADEFLNDIKQFVELNR